MKKIPFLCRIGLHIFPPGKKGLIPGSVMSASRCIRCGLGR